MRLSHPQAHIQYWIFKLNVKERNKQGSLLLGPFFPTYILSHVSDEFLWGVFHVEMFVDEETVSPTAN